MMYRATLKYEILYDAEDTEPNDDYIAELLLEQLASEKDAVLMDMVVVTEFDEEMNL
jgi:hypothetical protein